MLVPGEARKCLRYKKEAIDVVISTWWAREAQRNRQCIQGWVGVLFSRDAQVRTASKAEGTLE